MTNNTTAIGLGIILSRDTIPDVDNKVIVISDVLHSDYNPAVSFLLLSLTLITDYNVNIDQVDVYVHCGVPLSTNSTVRKNANTISKRP